MLVLGVSPVADRPEAVERGRVEAGEVPVRDALHARLVEGEPEFASDPLGREPEGGLRAVLAIGGRPNVPVTRRLASSCTGTSARIAASTRRASLVRTRTSTLALAVGATTFGRSPPSIAPTLTVTPRSGSWSAKSRWIWYESLRIALTPSPGLTPACDAPRRPPA